MSEAPAAPRLLGFAGHRKVQDPAALASVIRSELQVIAELYGPRLTAFCSAAAGADLVFLKTCAELRIPAIIILPFPKARFARDFENPDDWHLAESLMSIALATYEIKGCWLPPHSYQVVSRQLLEFADAFLFAWNGQPPRGKGGTGETVSEAADLGIPARIIDASSLQTHWSFPPDTSRQPRHGFTSRKDLLDFLDTRLTCSSA